MKVSHKDTLFFIGDSIADAGRERSDWYHAALGNGYVSLVNALLSALHPDVRVKMFNPDLFKSTLDRLVKKHCLR